MLFNTELNDEQKEYGKTIRANAENLMSVINNILDFSRMDICELKLHIVEFNLRNMIFDIIEGLSLKAGRKNLTLKTSIDDNISSELYGDPVRLRQILVNILDNAIKFTDNGEVLFRVEIQEENSKYVNLLFSVSDTGIGIADECSGGLFSPFSQADTSRTRKYGGAGLGLAISKKLAELMGGDMGVISKEGRGSTFWFTLSFEKKPHLADLKFEKKRVLIIDNNETERFLLKDLLKSLGFSIEVASSGGEGLGKLFQASVDKVPFGFVIVALDLPGIDGFEVTKLIRNSQKSLSGYDVKIIAMSRSECKDLLDCLKEKGMDGCINQPFKKEELFMVFKEVLKEEISGEGEKNKLGRHTLDWSNLLKRFDDDYDFCRELVVESLEYTSEKFEHLKDAAKKEKFSFIAAIAHDLKGTLGSIEAGGLSQIACNMVVAARKEEPVQTFVDDFGIELESLREFVENNLNGQSEGYGV